MEPFLGLVLVTLTLAGILAFMMKGMRPQGGPGKAGARRWGDLRRYHDTDTSTGWVASLVATIAVSSLATALGATTSVTCNLAAVAGVGFAILGAAGATRTRTLAGGGAGILGIASTAISLFQDSECDAVPFALRAATFALLAIVAALTAFARVVTARPIQLTPLALFGALEVLRFIAGPFGIPLFATTAPAASITVALVASIAFGVFVGWAPRLTIGLGGTAIALTGIGIAAGLGTCQAPNQFGPLFALLSFAAAYSITTFISVPFRRIRA